MGSEPPLWAVGLFSVSEGHIERVAVVDAVVTANKAYGAGVLAGVVRKGGTIEDCITHGTLWNRINKGDGWLIRNTGGMVGVLRGRIEDSYAIVNILGGGVSGSLVGRHNSSEDGSTIINSFGAGTLVNGLFMEGGLVGLNMDDAPIINSYWLRRDGEDCWGEGSCDGCTCDSEDDEGYFWDVGNAPIDSWNFGCIWDDINDGEFFPFLKEDCIDDDDDGFCVGCGGRVDCDDRDPEINPGVSTEKNDCKDNKDNDCDGRIDCKDSNCKRKSYCDGTGRGAVHTLYWGTGSAIPIPPPPEVEELINQTPQGAAPAEEVVEEVVEEIPVAAEPVEEAPETIEEVVIEPQAIEETEDLGPMLVWGLVFAALLMALILHKRSF